MLEKTKQNISHQLHEVATQKFNSRGFQLTAVPLLQVISTMATRWHQSTKHNYHFVMSNITAICVFLRGQLPKTILGN